jgi:hypothetical protein
MIGDMNGLTPETSILFRWSSVPWFVTKRSHRAAGSPAGLSTWSSGQDTPRLSRYVKPVIMPWLKSRPKGSPVETKPSDNVDN